MIARRTKRLILRNWEDRDRPLFHAIHADPAVMEFFPFRLSRAEADARMDHIRGHIAATGFGFHALADGASDEALGMCGLERLTLTPIFPEGTIEIGWRLARPHWGRGYASEAARAWLDHGFETRGLTEIVAFTTVENTRSRAVMERLGLDRRPEWDFDHPRVPDSHPHLKPHVVYAVTAQTSRERLTTDRGPVPGAG